MKPYISESLFDLMEKAFFLSMKCAHSEMLYNGHYFTPRDIPDEKESDLVFGWADGLFHKYYNDRATGHCSSQAMADFDIAKFEESVITHIATMEKILVRVGPPKVLTKEDLRERGYKV